MQGTVKWFNTQNGYGFIVDSETKKDVFCHYSQIQMKGFRTLNADDIVSFEVSDPDENNRVHATNVQPVLTLSMVIRELKKNKLHVKRNEDNKNVHEWYVVDKSDHPVAEKAMDLMELAKYAGFTVVQQSA